jgi:PIN domain nuclease of toxin-antitoxin system
LVPRLLLDTHIVVRWISEPKKLSRIQWRLIRQTLDRKRPVAISSITLLEIANLFATAGRVRSSISLNELFRELRTAPLFQILPITFEIAAEVAALGGLLTDPADRAIVATARVNQLRLVTSDQRIIESKLVPVIE